MEGPHYHQQELKPSALAVPFLMTLFAKPKSREIDLNFVYSSIFQTHMTTEPLLSTLTLL